MLTGLVFLFGFIVLAPFLTAGLMAALAASIAPSAAAAEAAAATAAAAGTTAAATAGATAAGTAAGGIAANLATGDKKVKKRPVAGAAPGAGGGGGGGGIEGLLNDPDLFVKLGVIDAIGNIGASAASGGRHVRSGGGGMDRLIQFGLLSKLLGGEGLIGGGGGASTSPSNADQRVAEALISPTSTTDPKAGAGSIAPAVDPTGASSVKGGTIAPPISAPQLGAEPAGGSVLVPNRVSSGDVAVTDDPLVIQSGAPLGPVPGQFNSSSSLDDALRARKRNLERDRARSSSKVRSKESASPLLRALTN